MKNLELKKLICGMKNVVIVEDGEGLARPIREITNNEIPGRIFRNSFGTSMELEDYTNADYLAIYAQYSLTYGWADKFEEFLGADPRDIFNQYEEFHDRKVKIAILSTTNNEPFTVKGKDYYYDVLKEIAESKTVLRKQQLDIIKLMPGREVLKVFNDAKFTIKETEIEFMSQMYEHNVDIFFKDPDQIVRFAVKQFNVEPDSDLSYLTKHTLKLVNVKIPTRLRKNILESYEKMDQGIMGTSWLKYGRFTKRLLEQLRWTTNKKMLKRYPKFMSMKEQLYKNEIAPARCWIETERAQGNLHEALFQETGNPGMMIRNLFSYLRYPAGSVLASKSNNGHKTVVKYDVSYMIKSNMFRRVLEKVNTKLLIQVHTMLEDRRWYEDKQTRTTHGKEVVYTNKLPGLDMIMSIQVMQIIEEILRKVGSQNDRKIYIDESTKNYMLQFTGREDTSISLSGEYLTNGSILDIKEHIGTNSCLRLGCAWKGEKSIDIDLSSKLFGKNNRKNILYYGRPVLEIDDNILAVSSGDITRCNNNEFSVELIDIDIDQCIEYGYTDIINSAIVFSGNTFNDTEAYWFLDVITKEERVTSGRKVRIPLDGMKYATQITEKQKAMIGVYVKFDKGEITILNQSNNVRSYSNMNNIDTEKIFDNMSKYCSVSEAFDLIYKDSLIDSASDADIVISTTRPQSDKDVTYYHPGRDLSSIQEILFGD